MSLEIEELQAWMSADRLVAESLGEWFGAPMVRRPSDCQSWRPELAAELALTSTNARRRLRVTLQSDQQSLQTLCDRLFGAAADGEKHDLSLLEDLLREATNVSAGAIKAAALHEGVILTTGLPVSLPLDAVREQASALVQRFALDLQDDQNTRVRMIVVLRSHEAESQPRSVENLRDGMVVLYDVSDDQGAVLASAGTRLTSYNVTTIAQRLDAGHLVEVAIEG